MGQAERGKLLLSSVPDGTVEKAVVDVLVGLSPGVSPDKVAALVRKAPVTLSADVTAAMGRRIAAELERLGAVASFVPHAGAGLEPEDRPGGVSPSPDPASRISTMPKASPPLRPEALAAPPIPLPNNKRYKTAPGRRRVSRPIAVAAVLTLAVAALYVLSGFFPGVGKAARSVYTTTLAALEGRWANPGGTDRPPPPKQAAFMTVPPEAMFAAFAGQYRHRPDKRFLLAFEALTKRREQMDGGKDPGRFRVGDLRIADNAVVVPLLRDGAVVKEVALPVPATFREAQAALDAWAAALEEEGTPRALPADAGKFDPGIAEAALLVDMTDPRFIEAGLVSLENLWREGCRDPRILRTAARGYATLLMVLAPDRMELSDPFAAEALSFLALARSRHVGFPTVLEEALLAIAMGYRAHAASLLEGMPKELRSSREKALHAYMRQDLKLLVRVRDSSPGVLEHYLLARLYRESGLGGEAKAAAWELLRKWPTLYPSAVENILSGDLGIAKVLTVHYPEDILEHLRSRIRPGSPEHLRSFLDILKAELKGEREVVSLPRFEALLTAWTPFNDAADPPRFIIDADRLKWIHRALYTDAVLMRFTLLLDQWGVPDMARSYADLIAGDGKDCPVALLMAGRVAAELSGRDAADAILERAIAHPGMGGAAAYDAYDDLSGLLAHLRSLPAAVSRLDGRPSCRLLTGHLLQEAYNYDLAMRFYASGLADDPFSYWGYEALAWVSGSDAPLLEALEKYPYSYRLLETAGTYLSKKSGDSLKKAEHALALAQRLAPSVDGLAERRAKVLCRLGRHDEAIAVLSGWIDRFGDEGLGTVVMKVRQAEIYRKTGRPRKALETLGDAAESWQAGALMATARAHEDLGDIERARVYYLRAVERYPTVGWVMAEWAGSLWRQGDPGEAARAIARGRPSQKALDRWYQEVFMEVFGNAPSGKIMAAVDALGKSGAAAQELMDLGWSFHRSGRNDVAIGIMSGTGNPKRVLGLEGASNIYRILRGWKGREEASRYLRGAVPPPGRGLLMMIFYNQGVFEGILEEAGDPDSYPEPHREFIWLQKLMAWLALDRKDASLADAFEAHYRDKALFGDKYHAIGRYLLGEIPRGEMLGWVRNAKDRCEIAYYMGFAERLKGNYAEASQWYHLCLGTLLQKNGELHWAHTELFWWGHMGIANRHRLMKDDIETYHRQTAEKNEAESKQKSKIREERKVRGSRPTKV